MLTLSQTASRTMGDLCRKAGEKVLAEIVSTLRTKATSPDARTREGVCIAIGDLVYVLCQSSLTSTQPVGTGKIHLILNGNNTRTTSSPWCAFPWWTTTPMFVELLQRHSTCYKNIWEQRPSTRPSRRYWTRYVNLETVLALRSRL